MLHLHNKGALLQLKLLQRRVLDNDRLNRREKEKGEIMNSMTGYACNSLYWIVVTAKSVNSKYLDVNISAPNNIDTRPFKTLATKVFSRGAIDITIKITGKDDLLEKAKAYYKVIKSLVVGLKCREPEVLMMIFDCLKSDLHDSVLTSGLIGGVADELDTPNSKVPKAFSQYNDILEEITGAVKECLDLLANDRAREGQFLHDDLVKKVAQFENLVYNITSYEPKMEELFRNTLESKFHELLGANTLGAKDYCTKNAINNDKNDAGDNLLPNVKETVPNDLKLSAGAESLITSEVAVMLVRYTINEEIVRLNSHIECLKKLLEDNNPIGRKLDFLCQEILRELNTISSKSQFAELSHLIVEAKDLLESIREQSRNVE